MAIVFDAQGESSGVEVYDATTTFAHTMAAGEGRIIVVGTVCKYTVGRWVSGITYGGEALAKLTRVLWNTTHYIELWYLVNPPTGVNNVIVTYTGNTYDACVSLSYTGVDPNIPFGALQAASGNSNTPTAPTVTSETGEVVIDIAGVAQTPISTFTPGALQTERGKIFEVNGGLWAGMSDEPGQTSVDMTWDHQWAKPWAIIAVPLNPYLPVVTRPIEYTLDVWDLEQRIFDANGHIVPRYKIKPNNWCRIVGLESTTAIVYESNYEDPTLVYFESVSYDGETDEVQIITNRGDLPEVIMARLASGSTG